MGFFLGIKRCFKYEGKFTTILLSLTLKSLKKETIDSKNVIWYTVFQHSFLI